MDADKRVLTTSKRVGVSIDASPISRSGMVSACPSRIKVRSSLGVVSVLVRPDASVDLSGVAASAAPKLVLSSEARDCERALVGVRYPALPVPAVADTLIKLLSPVE